MVATRKVFLTGGTGYMGRRLIIQLIERGHDVRALVRAGSQKKLPPGCVAVAGDALDQSTFRRNVPPADTFVQLVGVPHPSPRKAPEFHSIDLASARAGIAAAAAAQVRHFVYVSVAHPAPVMKAYWQSRVEAEEILRASALNATVLRPWYVLGPGHRWPYALLPVYRLFERLPGSSETAKRLGLVTIDQMITALVDAVENPVTGIKIVDVPGIRAAGS